MARGKTAIACALLGSLAVFPPPSTGTQVTGSINVVTGSDLPDIFLTCTLSGTTCPGFANLHGRKKGCSNIFSVTASIALTGLDLSKRGPIQGTLSSPNNHVNAINNADGTCTYSPGTPTGINTFPYSGAWNGSAGFLTFTGTDDTGAPVQLRGSFTADTPGPHPIFPMAVSGNIDASAASITANIQFRAQDAGTSGGVYVFAIAPAKIVRGVVAKDTSSPCVLAQLDPTGQLQAVTGSGLQAYTAGTLSAQGQAVTLLNNVPTPNVAGATVNVGYGASPSAMLANGTYRGAVTVPDAEACPGSSASYEGLWLKTPPESESGWGLNLAHQGTILFGTWFTYDIDGSGLWLVMSNGAQASPGSFSGTLYRTTGPAFNAVPFTSIAFPANYTEVGTLTLSFIDANTGTMSYTVNGTTQSKPIGRYVYATGGTNCVLGGTQGAAPNYQDLWLKADEAGWGVNLTHQGDILFATWFTYQAGGKGQWLVMSNGNKTAPGSYGGELQRTTGPPFNAVPFNPAAVTRTTVGSATFSFSDANNGTFAYTLDGISQSKPITRYIYSSPTTVCQ